MSPEMIRDLIGWARTTIEARGMRIEGATEVVHDRPW